MKVTLIDYTGRGSDDPLYAARLLIYTKNTRLTQGEETRMVVAGMSETVIMEELSYIANTIRSSWEFVDYTFEIQGVTRAFTHQLVRTRTASYAQQSQRSVDMSDFETLLPDSTMNADGGAAWYATVGHISTTYKYYQEHGVPAEDCRGLLPTNILTNIIMKMNLRTLADLLPKRKSLRAQGEYTNVAKEMERCVLDVHPWAKEFIDPDRLATPHLDQILKALVDMLAREGKTPSGDPALNNALKELDKLKGTWG